MKNFWFIIFTAICMAISLPAMPQSETNTVQLASKYYQNGEYEKALTLYEDLYAKTEYKSYRDMYVSCLTLLKQFDAAEKFLKKEIKKKKADFYLHIDLGMVYYNTNRSSESEEQFDKAKELALANESSVASAANYFQSHRQFQHAIDLYEKAEKKFPNKNYGLEIGNIYSVEKNYEQMMSHYLDYLNKENVEAIESRLSYVIANDSEDKAITIIEKALVERAQKNPNSGSLNTLTIWLYTQTGRHELALNQILAYSKRIGPSYDKEVLEFGNEMANINEIELAKRTYEYLLKRKTSSTYNNEAYIGLLTMSYKQAVSKLNPDRKELEDLDSTITLAIKDMAITKAYDLIIISAKLKAFNLGKCDEAIDRINEAISSNYYKQKVPEMKLLLGDIYMLNNNPWDATLTYAQIEKSNASADITSEARYRKAKLAYYTGQFEWAQAQLDVLKAGTSKLISNDALELSLFIAENYDMDTTETTMRTFARADFLTFSKQYAKALLCLDTIEQKYPSHSLSDDVMYRKAQIYEQTNDLDKAASLYHEVFTKYGFDVLADNALFKYAEICERQGKNKEAEDSYFKLISDYTGSIYTVEARKRMRALHNGTDD
ncbi:MAG: tetratricopeptide repeat protein [Bacteroidales bacterium]|nr:tetratricopeptide repeat protein [Bacteroidales bacterium]